MGKQIYRSNVKILKFFDKREIGSIPRIFLSSLAVLFFFYSMPKIINYAYQEANEF